MRGRKSGRSSFFCKQQVAPSIDPALAGEKPVRPIRAPGFSRAGESAEVFRLASIRRQVLQALLSPTVPQDRRRQTPLQSVLWLSLLRGAGQSPILLFLLILLARRGSSARRVLPAPRETFRCARVSPGLRANLARYSRQQWILFLKPLGLFDNFLAHVFKQVPRNDTHRFG